VIDKFAERGLRSLAVARQVSYLSYLFESLMSFLVPDITHLFVL